MWMSRKKYQEIMLKEQYVKTQLERLLKLSEEVKLLRGIEYHLRNVNTAKMEL